MKEIDSGKVLVVGDCMLDRYWQGQVNRISPEAPVPIVKMTSQIDRLGGAANVALNVRHLDNSVGLLGVIGKDEPGTSFKNILEENRIISYIFSCSNSSTVVKLRVVSQKQQLLRIDIENQIKKETLKHIILNFSKIISGFNCVVFSDYNKGSLDNISSMINIANKKGILVIVDPKGDDFTKYRGAYVITPNQSELAQILGSWDDEDDLQRKAFQMLEKLDIANLLLTRSERGMSLFSKANGLYHRTDYAAEAREVYDVTGAGDTAVATLAVMLSEGRPLIEASRIANRAAGLVVGKFGTSSISRQELFASECEA
jgi:rfaE bifunctional protein kinase chain/domain